MTKPQSEVGKEKVIKVLYCDLDGTIRKGFDELGRFVNSEVDVELFEGVAEKLKAYKEAGWRIVGITNQGGVSLGHLSYENMEKAVEKTQELSGYIFDRIMACIHHPDAKDKEFSVCWCRKPRIGLVVESALSLGQQYEEYYPPHMALFIGDRPEDKQCAENANIKFMDAKEWRNKSIKELNL